MGMEGAGVARVVRLLESPDGPRGFVKPLARRSSVLWDVPTRPGYREIVRPPPLLHPPTAGAAATLQTEPPRHCDLPGRLHFR